MKTSHAVYGGENTIGNITSILKNDQVKHVVTFIGKGIRATGLFVLPEAAARAAGVDYYVLGEIPPEPSYTVVQNIVDQFKVNGVDMIIARGDDSVMGAVKLASVFVTEGHGVKELLDGPGHARKCVPIILIPTTTGTGAEATLNIIVAVPKKKLKVGIANENTIVDYVILDTRMTKNLPRPIAAATGTDVLVYYIECFISNKTNPFSNLYALKGLDPILNNIEKACDDPEAMAEKGWIQIATCYSGLAITASGITAVHALSYLLGGKYHIVHGTSNTILLVPMMRFSAPICQGRLAQAYDRYCHDTIETCHTAQEKTEWIIGQLERIVRHLDIPTSLREFSAPREDLDDLVAVGMQVQRLLGNNMRPVTAENAKSLYLEVMQTIFKRKSATMKHVELKGIITPVLAPVNSDESVHLGELRNQIDRLLEGGVHGLFPFSTNDEGYILNGNEKIEVLEAIVDQVKGCIPVYTGSSCISTIDTIRMNKEVRKLGADVLSIITPSFALVSQRELYDYYVEVAKHADIPIVLYNIPAHIGNKLLLETVAKLAKDVDVIMDTKNSSGGQDNPLTYIILTEELDKDFRIPSGNDSLILPYLKTDGAGGITGCTSVYPHVLASVYDLFQVGKLEEAEVAQGSIASFHAVFKYGNPNIVTKKTVSLLDYPVDDYCRPFNCLCGGGVEALKLVLKENADKGMY